VDGKTPFIPGPLPLAIHLANETGLACLCLEEISTLTPGAQKMVNSITDWRSGIYMSQTGQSVRLRDDAYMFVIATMNPSTYAGGFDLNLDLRSRFVEEVLEWPSDVKEREILTTQVPEAPADLVELVLRMAAETRTSVTETHLSTRDLVTFLEDLIDLPNHKTEVLNTVLNRFTSDADRTVMRDRMVAIFADQGLVKKTRKKAG
jgi:MoxR-like ATPase